MTLRFTEDSVNLSEIGFLVADPSDLYRELFRRLLYGFGAKKVLEARDTQTARRLMIDRGVDFLICAADLPVSGAEPKADSGLDFVRGIRLDRKHPLRAIPMIVTMGTARRMPVGQSRDSGANFVLSKPVSPVVLYDRINWIARNPRPFWESERFFGPDRRFREKEYNAKAKRRQTDVVTVEAADAE